MTPKPCLKPTLDFTPVAKKFNEILIDKLRPIAREFRINKGVLDSLNYAFGTDHRHYHISFILPEESERDFVFGLVADNFLRELIGTRGTFETPTVMAHAGVLQVVFDTPFPYRITAVYNGPAQYHEITIDWFIHHNDE